MLIKFSLLLLVFPWLEIPLAQASAYTPEDVREAYRTCLGREPESERAVQNHSHGHGGDSSRMLKAICNSPEGQLHRRRLEEQVVTDAYLHCLGRQPESDIVARQLPAVREHGRDRFFSAICSSPESLAYQNRLKQETDQLSDEHDDLKKSEMALEAGVWSREEKATELGGRISLQEQKNQSDLQILTQARDDLLESLESKEKALNEEIDREKKELVAKSDQLSVLSEMEVETHTEMQQLEIRNVALESQSTAITSEIENSLQTVTRDEKFLGSLKNSIQTVSYLNSDEDSLKNALKQISGSIVHNDQHCSATLVADDKVLTASHCLPEGENEVVFTNFLGQKFTAQSWVMLGELGYITLAKPAEVGLALVLDETPSSEQNVLISFEDVKANNFRLQYICQIKEVYEEDGYFTHDCPTTPGSSGSAILNGNRLMGIHLGRLSLNTELGVGVFKIDSSIIPKLDLEGSLGNLPKPISDLGKKIETGARNTGNSISKGVGSVINPVTNLVKGGFKSAQEGLASIGKSMEHLGQGAGEIVSKPFHTVNDRVLGKNRIRLSIAGTRENITSLQSKTIQLDKKIESLNSNLKKLEKQGKKIANDIKASVEKSLSDLGDFPYLKDKIGEVDKRLKHAQKQLTNVQDQLKTTLSKIDGKNSILTSLMGSVEKLKSETKRFESAIYAKRKQLKDLTERIDLAAQVKEAMNTGLQNLSKGLQDSFNALGDNPVAESLRQFRFDLAEFLQTKFIDNIQSFVDWAVGIFAESGPQGEKAWEKTRVIENIDNVWQEIHNNSNVFTVSSNNSFIVNLIGFSKIAHNIKTQGGFVCDMELKEAATSGEPGVHFVQVSPEEFCRMRHRHVENYARTGYRRSIQKAACYAEWNFQRVFDDGKKKPATFKCVDYRGEMKAQRDRIDAAKVKSREELALLKDELAPLVKDQNSQDLGIIEKEILKNQKQAEIDEKDNLQDNFEIAPWIEGLDEVQTKTKMREISSAVLNSWGQLQVADILNQECHEKQKTVFPVIGRAYMIHGYIDALKKATLAGIIDSSDLGEFHVFQTLLPIDKINELRKQTQQCLWTDYSNKGLLLSLYLKVFDDRISKPKTEEELELRTEFDYLAQKLDKLSVTWEIKRSIDLQDLSAVHQFLKVSGWPHYWNSKGFSRELVWQQPNNRAELDQLSELIELIHFMRATDWSFNQ